mgnify:CR=1 FL=1|jgi:AraC-like DNA-binding protein
MARIVPLLELPGIRVHRFDHPVEHEDQPYEEVAETFMASFVEDGAFDLHVGERRWRARTGDVMISHPGMRFRAEFEGKGFNDTCLSLTYTAAVEDGFDPEQSWSARSEAIRAGSNRVRYLYWGLSRAVSEGLPMLAEYCATEVFRAHDESGRAPYRARTMAWYAERVHAVRERIEREFDRPHTVTELASSVGMSLFNFTRVFTELTGQPPHTYLRDVRLDQARAMLRAGRSVTETCYACGFNNLSHFSRSFSRRHGAPPSAALA